MKQGNHEILAYKFQKEGEKENAWNIYHAHFCCSIVAKLPSVFRPNVITMLSWIKLGAADAALPLISNPTSLKFRSQFHESKTVAQLTKSGLRQWRLSFLIVKANADYRVSKYIGLGTKPFSRGRIRPFLGRSKTFILLPSHPSRFPWCSLSRQQLKPYCNARLRRITLFVGIYIRKKLSEIFEISAAAVLLGGQENKIRGDAVSATSRYVF